MAKTVAASEAQAANSRGNANTSITEDATVMGIAFVNERNGGSDILKISIDPTKLGSMPCELIAFQTKKGSFILREDTMSKNYITRLRKSDEARG